MKSNHLIFGYILLIGALSSCSSRGAFDKAQKLEEQKEYQRAWEKYQEFVANNPEDVLAPQALYRCARIAQEKLGDCFMAQTFYAAVAERYPASQPWARSASYFKNNCPDYFPLLPGWSWVEGDSETHGHNAKIDIQCKNPNKKEDVSGAAQAILSRTYYAGSNKFKTADFLYKKTESEVMEYGSPDDPRSKIILKWPLEKGTSWTTKFSGKTYQYEIAAVDKTVKVAAGEFKNCLLVRSTIEGYASATQEYYAPDVGRVLVTYVTSQGENRNTELLSYKSAALPDEALPPVKNP
jgi:hypothetical protein